MRRLFRDEEGSVGVWLRLLQTAPLGHGLPPLPLRNRHPGWWKSPARMPAGAPFQTHGLSAATLLTKLVFSVMPIVLDAYGCCETSSQT